MVCILLVGFLAGCTNKMKIKETEKYQRSRSTDVTLGINNAQHLCIIGFSRCYCPNSAFEGLYSLDEQDQLVPAVAKALPMISEDGKTYTISLRKAVWSNDDPVTAHDFEYAWKK